MSGFYGNSLSSSLGFEIDLRYPNKKVMDFSANSDSVFVGRYVLIDYYQTYQIIKDNKVVDGTFTSEVTTNYQGNYKYDDGKRSYDSTLWQKIFDDGQYKYIMVADLNGVDIGVELIAPSKVNNGDRLQLSIEKDGIRYVQLPNAWDIDVNTAAFDYGADGFDKTKSISKPTSYASASFTDTSSKGSTTEYDTKSLNLSIPGVGYAVSEMYNEMYGANREWANGASPTKPDGSIDYDADPGLVQEIKKAVHNSTTTVNTLVTNTNSSVENILDSIYGPKAIDSDSDGVLDTRVWESGINNPLTNSSGIIYDTSVLSDVKQAIENILDHLYGKQTYNPDGTIFKDRPWKDPIDNPPKSSSGLITYNTDVILSDIAKTIAKIEENSANSIKDVNQNLTDLLDLVYGFQTAVDSSGNPTGPRPWESGIDNPPRDSSGITYDDSILSDVKEVLEKLLDELYGEQPLDAAGNPIGNRPWINGVNNPPLIGPGPEAADGSNIDYDNSITSKVKQAMVDSSNDFNKLLDEFYGAKIDTDGDTIPDTRPWADNNVPTKPDGTNDYSANCVLSKTQEVIENNETLIENTLNVLYGKEVGGARPGTAAPNYDDGAILQVEHLLDSFYGEDTDRDGHRSWDNGLNNPPLNSDGSIDYSESCVLSETKKALEDNSAMLDVFYGQDNDGNGVRDWYDSTNFPKNSSGELDYSVSPCIVSKTEEALEKAGKALTEANTSIIDTNELLDKFYGELQDSAGNRTWENKYPMIGDKPDYTSDPCIISKNEKMLDAFYGAIADADGDGILDARPWENGINNPPKDPITGKNDYSANCVLSETKKALDTLELTQDEVLDTVYGNNRDWEKGNVPTTDGNPLKADGSNLDTSDACILLDVKQAIIRSDNAMNDTLDKFYGENSRSWIDETKYPTTTDSAGNVIVDYTQDECYVSNILEATENANKALSQANTNVVDTNDLLNKFYGKVQDATTGERTWENSFPTTSGGTPDYSIDPCVVSKVEKMLDTFYGFDDDKDGERPWENGVPLDVSGKVDYSSDCVLSKNKLAVDETNDLLNKSYGKNRKWSDPASYPSLGVDADGNPIYDYNEDSCLISSVLKATELANKATAETENVTDAILDDFYGKDRKWINSNTYPDVDANGVPDYDTDSCIVSKTEKLLDSFYGLKIDTDGDGIVDTRPWDKGLNNPPLNPDGSIDYSESCVLSETKKAIENSNKIENTLDKLYGLDTDGDGKRPWEDETNPPKDASGNIDYTSSPCVISKVERILNNIYGIMQDSSGSRTWEDDKTPIDSATGKIDYSIDTCLISQVKEATEKANDAADVLNTFTTTFNELTDGVIPYVKVVGGKKEFYGMTLVAGDDIVLQEIPDTSGTGVRTIKISVAVSAAEILPFEATPLVS